MKSIIVSINREEKCTGYGCKGRRIARTFNYNISYLNAAEPDPDDFLELEAGSQCELG